MKPENIKRDGELIKLSLTPDQAMLISLGLAILPIGIKSFSGDKQECAEMSMLIGSAGLSQAELEFLKNAMVGKVRNPKDADELMTRIHNKLTELYADKKEKP